MESGPAEKHLEMLVGDKLDMRQQRALAAHKAKHILGCIQRSAANRYGEGILPLCSPLSRLHMVLCIQLWGPQHKTDKDLLEQVQRRPRK